MAVEKGNLEIAKLLLANPTIDVNIETIFNFKIFIIFQYANFKISFKNQVFKSSFKSKKFIKFKIYLSIQFHIKKYKYSFKSSLF